MRALKALGCAIALATLIAPGARADQWNKLTYLTFSGPVQLPGVTLPAGTYTFKLADSWSNRHIVQVFDKDQSRIYGTFLTVSDQRLKPADKPVVMFNESAAGRPSAVRAWFYPGGTIGDEFVYSKRQAVEIARATHEPVMATDEEANDAAAMKRARVGHVDENGRMTEDNEGNRASSSDTNTAGASGTTGVYTAAPRETDRRSGVSGNADTMNRYGPTGTSGAAAGRSTNRSMAPGGETVVSTSPSAGSTAGAAARKSAAVTTRAGEPTAKGTSGQADRNAANGAKANARRLPATASPLGLLELLGAVSIGGALTLRQFRKRFAGAR